MEDQDRKDLLAKVKKAWLIRAEALELKGRARHAACLNFLAGVRVGLGGDDETHTAVDGVMMIVSFQGARALEMIDG